jgi:chloramphenicol O-acetyltransferase type A
MTMQSRKSLSGRSIDIKAWKRRAHYELFRHYEQPFFSVTVDVDVTTLWNVSRRPRGPSFFLASLFLMLQSINDTEAFRLRLRKRGVWLHDTVAVGATVLNADDTFGFARIEPCKTLAQFVSSGRTAIAQTKRLSAGRASARWQVAGVGRRDTLKDDIVFHSVLPWLRLRSFTNALPGSDSIPRIVFGKVAEGREVSMPVAVEVHHALVDGLDVARFLERFQARLDKPEI